MSMCKKCEREIIWCTTEAGKNMPVDAEPVKDGMFVIVKGTAKKADLEDIALLRPRYTSHFATCAFADEFRKTR